MHIRKACVVPGSLKVFHWHLLSNQIFLPKCCESCVTYPAFRERLLKIWVLHSKHIHIHIIIPVADMCTIVLSPKMPDI